MIKNIYHRYLNLPVAPGIDLFAKTDYDPTTIGHVSIEKDSINPELIEWLAKFNISPMMCEAFYTPPNGGKIYIHTDTATVSDAVKINWTYGAPGGRIVWWQPKHVNKIKQMETEFGQSYLTIDEDECNKVYEADTNKPSLVQVGTWHSTWNPSAEGRWTLSLPLYDTTTEERITWDEANKRFSDVIYQEDPSDGIFRQHHLVNADYYMSFQEALRNEFLKGYDSLESAVREQASLALDPEFRNDLSYDDEILSSRKPGSNEFVKNNSAWKAVGFKYSHDDAGIHFDGLDNAEEEFPTAVKFIRSLGDACPVATYSILEPQTILNRHNGPENILGETIRIHIPLIIPEGDVFLEVDGTEVQWNDIWGFNNQLPHSAYNLTDEYRLVFFFDIRRDSIELVPGKTTPGDVWDTVKPFIRKLK
jgi:hypothetical protein